MFLRTSEYEEVLSIPNMGFIANVRISHKNLAPLIAWYQTHLFPRQL